MDWIFINIIKNKLRKQIKGVISVHVIEDILVVDITNGIFQNWRYTVAIQSVKLPLDLAIKIIPNVIVKQYKNDILDCYFYN